MKLKTYLTTDQIAEKLGLRARTIQQHIRDGWLKAEKVGRTYRVEEGVFMQWASLYFPKRFERVKQPATAIAA